MVRSLLTAAAFAALAVAPAQAFDIEAMSDAERKAFRSEIRSYLIENPEVLMEAIEVLERRRARDAAQAEVVMLDNYRDQIFNDGVSWEGGNPDGDITIVEFLDYRCSFCKRAFPAVEELIASDGNIKIIVKEFPILGEASVLGSRYALATKRTHGDDAYKMVHDAMMELRGDLNERAIERISDGLDLDHDDIEADMESEEITQIIADNRDLGARLQIQGTPSFIMGERFVRGFVELDQMRAIVAEERG